MKNIIKALVVLASVVSFSSANAGVLEVTGTAKATYSIQGSDSTTGKNDAGKGLGITNELAFTGTGELDNGFTWKYQVELDDNTSGATTSDDTRLEVTTPYGTVAAYNTEGGLSTKYKYSAAAYGAGSDNGAGGSIEYGQSIDSYNNLQYHTPAGLLPYETSFKVAYSPSADGSKNSGNSAGTLDTPANGNRILQYQIMSSPIDGLDIGASYLEKTNETGLIQGYEQGGVFAKYAYGSFTLGVGKNGVANNISDFATQTTATALNTATLKATVKSFENEQISLGYKVNDQLSVSYDMESSEAQKRTKAGTGDTKANVDLEINTLQAAYSMGGMTLSVSLKDIANQDYQLNKDMKETLFVVAMAF
jgi:outer membrane protein OmpU